ncbi:MAG: hypothetical protein TECD_00261 [Hyphomicrobiaceae bacterium hypho_1]
MLPTELSDELAKNPFIRAYSSEMRAKLNLLGNRLRSI